MQSFRTELENPIVEKDVIELATYFLDRYRAVRPLRVQHRIAATFAT